MDTWTALNSRRDVRIYENRPLPAGDLDRILEAGRRAPSSMNRQRWDFVVVTERDRLEELSRVWQGAGHVAASAATIALVVPAGEDTATERSIAFDLGQAAMAMLVAATALGIGSAHSAVRDQDLARRLLGHPADHHCAWLLVFGYPADRPLRPIRNPTRRPFSEVVHRGRW